MEAKELMHNDLFMCGGGVCRFVIRSMDAIVQRLSDKNEYKPCAVLNAEPIPLTEEILKANGFDSKDHWYYKIRVNGCFDVSISFKYNEIEILKIDGVGTDCEEVYYGSDIQFGTGKINVHELQHTLRLCGLNELADNFVIR